MASRDIFEPTGFAGNSMIQLEQYVERVVDYTSMYNSSFGISFSPESLVGKYEVYPSYGDFPETYILRTYGTWWKESEMHQKDYMPQDVDPFGAEDYVTLRFESAVIPRHIFIYETYNPGAVVRVRGRLNSSKWKLLWEGAPQAWGAHSSRVFRPKINHVNSLINEVRLEFNQSNLRYHTAIDAVLLGGYQPKYSLHYAIFKKDLSYWVSSPETSLDQKVDGGSLQNGEDPFLKLPNEILLHIFRSLDLISLSRCAQVCRKWYQISKEPTMCQNLSLKKYWHMVTSDTINVLKDCCKSLKKLDLSWCEGKADSEDDIDMKSEPIANKFASSFIDFVESCCEQLTHLSLCHCSFVSNAVIDKISNCAAITDLRLTAVTLHSVSFHLLSRFSKLVALDLSRTAIRHNCLLAILRANPHLKHINLDFCENLENLDDVVLTATLYNKQLTTWSSWKTVKLTSTGAGYFSKFRHLRELDLGWCFVFNDPGDSLKQIASGCRDLRRLILSHWRSVNDEMLLPVITNCKKLWLLDLLGIKSITSQICEKALTDLPELRMFEISFCVEVTDDEVNAWRARFPHVTIQRSFQHMINDYFH